MTEELARQSLKGYDSSHDWWHIERVRRLALFINKEETLADPLILEIAALLHDTLDSKFTDGDKGHGNNSICVLLEKAGLKEFQERILEVIRNVSFSNKNPTGDLTEPLLMIIQDADRLDAIGAIGIARAFNYGGFRNNSIYIPGERAEGINRSTIGHFYEKLLKLKGMMNTVTGRKIAEERHKYLEEFLEQFYREWEYDHIKD